MDVNTIIGLLPSEMASCAPDVHGRQSPREIFAGHLSNYLMYKYTLTSLTQNTKHKTPS